MMKSWLLAATLTVTACAKPEAPSVSPKSVTVQGITALGATLGLNVEVTNPNRFAMRAQRVSGSMMLGAVGNKLGSFTYDKPFELPSKQPVMMEVPLQVSWQSALAVAELTKGKDVPFTVEGNVAMGGETFQVNVPFTTHGTITQADLRAAALKTANDAAGLLAPLLLGK